jgi:hypothetical protein
VYDEKKTNRRKVDFTALLVDAATLAMFATALNVVQRLIGDVEQAAQVVALVRLLFWCNDFWVIFGRVHQAGNALEVLLVRRSRSSRVGTVRPRGSIWARMLLTHNGS